MKSHALLMSVIGTLVMLTGCGNSSPSMTEDQAASLSSAVNELNNDISKMNDAVGSESAAASATDSGTASSVAATSTDDLAAKLGCASVKPVEKLYTESAAICTLPNGHEVELAIFATTAARDQYLSDAAQIAPTAISVKGDKWSAGGLECTEADLAPLK